MKHKPFIIPPWVPEALLIFVQFILIPVGQTGNFYCSDLKFNDSSVNSILLLSPLNIFFSHKMSNFKLTCLIFHSFQECSPSLLRARFSLILHCAICFKFLKNSNSCILSWLPCVDCLFPLGNDEMFLIQQMWNNFEFLDVTLDLLYIQGKCGVSVCFSSDQPDQAPSTSSHSPSAGGSSASSVFTAPQ